MSRPGFVTVTTPLGKVRGRRRDIPGAEAGSAAFLGIPFAQPPVGDLRFAAPVPVEPWDGVRDALAFGATTQRGDPGVTSIPEPSVPGESTLNVNVFTPTPRPSRAKMPVLVWIHGGAFHAGSPASPWYDGRSFNRDGVVTVTISYRLGFDGFGWIEDAPANRGVLDWLCALEWVQANIAAFGGDPGRVTIAGQSAGGGAVLTLLGLPQAQHLFHRVWSVSGAVPDVPTDRAERIGRKIATRLEVEPTRAGIGTVPEESVLAAQQSETGTDGIAGARRLLSEGLTLAPVVDGNLIARPTLESIRAGVGAAKPLLLGATDDEFANAAAGVATVLRFVPLRVLLRLLGFPGSPRAYLAANRDVAARGHAALVGRYVSDWVFRRLVLQVATARMVGGGPAATWAYRFAHRSRTSGAAVHCLDVPFWFDCLDAEQVELMTGPNPPQGLADLIHRTAVAFIRGDSPGWPAWSESPGTTRVFDPPSGTPAVSPDGYASVRPLTLTS